MITFAGLCRDLFLLSQPAATEVAGPLRGHHWERSIGDYLAARGIRTQTLPGGYSFLGHASLSGLAHQLDAAISCEDALVIGEWKAHAETVPKNDLLRFKAVTDDYFMGLRGASPRRPVMRVFGGTGRSTEDLRRYAAIHGIVLLDRQYWPSPVVSAGGALWDRHLGVGPTASDCRQLVWLARSMQQELRLQADGSYLLPRPPGSARLDAALRHHDYWSDRLWESVDSEPGCLESMMEKLGSRWIAA
jgi:hypothetical protein